VGSFASFGLPTQKKFPSSLHIREICKCPVHFVGGGYIEIYYVGQNKWPTFYYTFNYPHIGELLARHTWYTYSRCYGYAAYQLSASMLAGCIKKRKRKWPLILKKRKNRSFCFLSRLSRSRIDATWNLVGIFGTKAGGYWNTFCLGITPSASRPLVSTYKILQFFKNPKIGFHLFKRLRQRKKRKRGIYSILNMWLSTRCFKVYRLLKDIKVLFSEDN